jgi:hypothetical protein
MHFNKKLIYDEMRTFLPGRTKGAIVDRCRMLKRSRFWQEQIDLTEKEAGGGPSLREDGWSCNLLSMAGAKDVRGELKMLDTVTEDESVSASERDVILPSRATQMAQIRDTESEGGPPDEGRMSLSGRKGSRDGDSEGVFPAKTTTAIVPNSSNRNSSSTNQTKELGLEKEVGRGSENLIQEECDSDGASRDREESEQPCLRNTQDISAKIPDIDLSWDDAYGQHHVMRFRDETKSPKIDSATIFEQEDDSEDIFRDEDENRDAMSYRSVYRVEGWTEEQSRLVFRPDMKQGLALENRCDVGYDLSKREDWKEMITRLRRSMLEQAHEKNADCPGDDKTTDAIPVFEEDDEGNGWTPGSAEAHLSESEDDDDRDDWDPFFPRGLDPLVPIDDE